MLSIKPRYVDKILSGTKTVELRRTTPALEPDAPVVLYSSSPVKAIVGFATLARIEEQSPTELWNTVGQFAGVTRAEYREYFAGASRAYGLQLTAVRAARTALPLEQIRLLGVEPPQSWRYLSADVAHALADLSFANG